MEVDLAAAAIRSRKKIFALRLQLKARQFFGLETDCGLETACGPPEVSSKEFCKRCSGEASRCQKPLNDLFKNLQDSFFFFFSVLGEFSARG